MISQLDPRTLVFMAGLLALVTGAILLILRRSFPADIRGIGEWAAATVLVGVAAGLFGMRGALPLFWTAAVPDIALFVAVALMLRGIRVLHGVPARMAPVWGVVALASIGVMYFTVVQPSLQFRVIGFTVYNLILFSLSAHTLLRRTAPPRGGAVQFTAAVYLLGTLVSATRLGTAVLEGSALNRMMAPEPMQIIYLGTYGLLLLALVFGFVLMAGERLRVQLERLARRDSLTDALNRRAFLESAERELQKDTRARRPTSLLMADLDEFKQINDRYGHALGDDVLVHYARILRRNLREIDLFGRYGGEEFCILLPETDALAASAAAERLRSAVADTPVRTGRETIRLTVSIGVATATERERELSALMESADRAMYRGKAAGRNRVAVAGQAPELRTVGK